MALLFHELATNAAKWLEVPRFHAIRGSAKDRGVTNGQIFYRPNGIRLRSPFQIIAASGHGYSYERSSNLVEK